jgi:hypothetical protein
MLSLKAALERFARSTRVDANEVSSCTRADCQSQRQEQELPTVATIIDTVAGLLEACAPEAESAEAAEVRGPSWALATR